MTDKNEAGRLIFTQLKTFNESMTYFDELDSSVCNAVDSCIEEFLDKDQWRTELNLYDDGDSWFAPEKWKTEDEDDDSYNTWFAVDSTNVDDDDDYWVVLFCGMGLQGAEAGFMFDYDKKAFGGKTAWKNKLKEKAEVVEEIVKLGFKQQNDGRFFLPVRLDNQQLADTWKEAGALEGNDDCFQPVRDALEKIIKAVPLFEELR